MKLELNVVRMTNEDVIATSGANLCNDLSAYSQLSGFGHIKVLSATGTADVYSCEFYKKSATKDELEYIKTEDLHWENIEVGKWYHFSPSMQAIECDEQSDEAHPAASH